MMKMTNLILIMSLFTASLSAPPSSVVSIPIAEAVRPYDALWRATCRVESKCNPLAIGDKHLERHSYGIVQIRKVRLDDYFKRTGIRYGVLDMFDVEKSKEVFMYYCAGTDLEYISRAWNGGYGGTEKQATLEYWKLIQTKL